MFSQFPGKPITFTVMKGKPFKYIRYKSDYHTVSSSAELVLLSGILSKTIHGKPAIIN